MKLITMVLISALSGCVGGTPEIHNMGEEVCINNDGLSSYLDFFFGDLHFTCGDGAKFKFTNADEAVKWLNERDREIYDGDFLDPKEIP